MFQTLAKGTIWLMLAATIVAVGWDEPLHYKFMSRYEIAEAEKVYLPRPKAPPPRNFQLNQGGSGNPLSSTPRSKGAQAKPGLETHKL